MKIAPKPQPRNLLIHIMRLQKNPDSCHENCPLSAPKNRPQTKHCWSEFRAAHHPYGEITDESKPPELSFPFAPETTVQEKEPRPPLLQATTDRP
jgi:hypothetical protein